MIESKMKEAFDPFYKAPIESWKKLVDLGERVAYTKGEVIKKANKKENYGYYLIEGAVGTFVWKKNNFVCLEIFLENKFFADDYSLTTNLSSPLEIISIEPSSVLRISRSNIELLKQTAIGKMLFLVGEQHDNANRQERQIDLMTQTAEERYMKVLKEQPDLLHRIPQKYIASYLGITAQSLSRIRRKFKQ